MTEELVSAWLEKWPLDGFHHPVAAYALVWELEALSFEWDEPSQYALDELPPCAMSWTLDPDFLPGLAASARSTASRIADCAHPFATCAADEVNILLAVRRLQEGYNAESPIVMALVATRPVEDWRFEIADFHDAVVEDLDVEMLWFGALDGLEDGFVDIHPRSWFESFAPK